LKKFIINGVEDDSILDQMEITAGDILLSINGLPVTDILDYRYLIADDSLEVEIEKADGEIWLLDIEKEYEDDLGVIFPEAMIGTKPVRTIAFFVLSINCRRACAKACMSKMMMNACRF